MKRGMFVAVLAVFALTGLGLTGTAEAGCTLGVRDCVGGFWYECQRCGSETCMIMTGKRCHRDGALDTFLGVHLEQSLQARPCRGASVLDRVLRGVQVRQPVLARVASVQVVAAPEVIAALN